jgi:hypothetical protein
MTCNYFKVGQNKLYKIKTLKMKTRNFIISLLVLIGMSVISTAQPTLSNSDKLLVGVAKMDITPPTGIRLAGYAQTQRPLPSQGIHDPIYAKVMVMEINGQRTAFVTCDLIWYYNKKVLDLAKEKFNIPHVLISFSHTHTGPSLNDSKEYANSVEKAIIDGMEEALKNMFPARISAGYKSFPQLGYNRLTGKNYGNLWRDYERIPYGPVDPEVGVIKIEDESGKPRIIMMQYACHPVANGHAIYTSADYPGIAAKKVEEAFGNNTVCMFIQGGAGDINPMFMVDDNGFSSNKEKGYIVTTDFTQIEKMGTLLANQVIQTAKAIQPKDIENASVKIISDSLRFRGRFDKEQEFNVHITTMLINNDIAIATFPGEPFVKFQLSWKENAEAPHPFFFGYTFSSGGKHPGYVADIRSAAYGGYGADTSPNIIEAGAGESIMNKHLINLYRLKGVMKDAPTGK